MSCTDIQINGEPWRIASRPDGGDSMCARSQQASGLRVVGVGGEAVLVVRSAKKLTLNRAFPRHAALQILAIAKAMSAVCALLGTRTHQFHLQAY